MWIGGDLGSAQTVDGGATWTIKTWWLYSQVPAIPYAHADHHAAVFKATGTPSIILGTDGGFSVSEDDGVTFSTAKNRGLATHLFYTVAGNAQFPNLVIGGTQDNGTRLRTDNGKTYNQVIGGDGMGAAYSQANTNTVIGSSQGSGMRANYSNNPPTTFQSTDRRDGRIGRLRVPVLYSDRPRAGGARCHRPRVLSLHEHPGVAHPERRTVVAADRRGENAARPAADFTGLSRGWVAHVPFEPVQPRRQPRRI